MIPSIILAGAGALVTPAIPAPAPLPLESEARKVIEVQLNSPPQFPELSRRLDAREVEMLVRRYLESIGQRQEAAREGARD